MPSSSTAKPTEWWPSKLTPEQWRLCCCWPRRCWKSRTAKWRSSCSPAQRMPSQKRSSRSEAQSRGLESNFWQARKLCICWDAALRSLRFEKARCLFNEAARMPSAGVSAALFRHGPVEIVDKRFRAIVFASQAATREIDLALASDIEGMGGKRASVPGPGRSIAL